MKLTKGETIIFEEGVSHFHHYLAVGGTLTLTNQRLHFSSNPCFHYHHTLDIPIGEVDKVEYFKTVFLNPNGLAILLKNGDIENFIVDDKKIVGEKILATISQEA